MGQLVITEEAKANVIPLAHSKSGKNCHYLKCEGTGRHASYVVCQHTVLAFKEKRLPPTSFADCQSCIGSSNCMAVRMMIAERKAGRALFFKEYKEPVVVEKPLLLKKQVGFGGLVSNKTNKANKTNKTYTPSKPNKADKPMVDAANMFADMVAATA